MAVFRIHPDVKYSPCRLAATAFLSDTLLIQPRSSSQTRDNRSVILFLPSFPFFFTRLFILIIFISLPRHRYRALSIQLFPLVICFDMFAISIKGSFPTMGTLLFKQGDGELEEQRDIILTVKPNFFFFFTKPRHPHPPLSLPAFPFSN